ncbi:MAG: ABC transporter ATP-binding protein [Longimicrobiales bacterium]|nr:ABC transporter ATP-binding protein [Longimicrobiales bacterium]
MQRRLIPTRSGSPAIRAARLRLVAGGRTLVSDLSFECVPGRVTALVGPNGSGKSSLLRLLLGLDTGGLDTTGEGSVEFRGPSAPRFGHYDPEMRLPTSATVAAWDRAFARTRPRVCTLRSGGIVPSTPLAGLSTGEEKRMLLEEILNRENDFIFLDEPFANLSDDGWSALGRGLRGICERRVVVLSTNRRDVLGAVGLSVSTIELGGWRKVS